MVDGQKLQEWKDQITGTDWKAVDTDELERILEEIWQDGFETGTSREFEPVYDPHDRD